jgi:hypothetical protein
MCLEVHIYVIALIDLLEAHTNQAGAGETFARRLRAAVNESVCADLTLRESNQLGRDERLSSALHARARRSRNDNERRSFSLKLAINRLISSL